MDLQTTLNHLTNRTRLLLKEGFRGLGHRPSHVEVFAAFAVAAIELLVGESRSRLNAKRIAFAFDAARAAYTHFGDEDLGQSSIDSPTDTRA